MGGSNSTKTKSTNISGPLCKDDHTGPLCQVCLDKRHYFDTNEEMCADCPRSITLGFLGYTIVVVLIIMIVIYVASKISCAIDL